MKSKLRAFAGVIISTASISAFGATEWQYSENDRTLTVIVPAGETNSFAVADADSVFRGYLTSNAVTNFVKLGSGGLYVDLDLYSYAGDLTVAEGTYTYTNPKALGNYYYSSGIVRVKNGATLNAHRLSTATKDDWGNKAVWGKRIWFEGAGADGRGALVYTSEGTPEDTRLHFSCNLKMTGNATIYNAAAGTLRLYGTSSNPAALDMGGHALTLDGATAGSAWSAWHISNPGSMAVRRPVQLESTYSELGGTDENVMSFDAGGALLFNNFGGKCGWTIDARNLSKITVRSGASASLGSVLTHSFWGGNIITGAKRLQVYYLDAVCNFTVGGTISGAGLYVYTDWRGGYIFNLSGSNSFTDGLAVKGDRNSPVRPGNLYVYSNGALPADGGALTLTDATVTFRTNDRLSLPPLSAANATAVNSGIGTWRDSIVKTGSGNLSWNSLTGGDVLDVREGGVVIRDEDRSMIAGLVEGELLFRNGTTAARAAYGIQHTNRVDYSMSAMYDSAHPFWTTPFPSGSDRRTFNYWGYVWNNDPTNVKWSVALYAATHSHLIFGGFITGDIDGFKTGVHYYNGTSPSVYTVELPPGPTPIQLSGYYTAASSGLKTKKDVWTRSDFGLGYDVLARASGNSTDYAKMIDPGDGSLFTWAMPKQIVEGVTKAPGSDEVVRLSPYFGTMKFAAGTGVTFRRGWYQVPVLEGLPAVNGITNALTVTSAFKFSAREVVAGRKLTTTGTFAIDEGVSIVIDDADGQGRRSRNGVCSFVIVQADSVMMPTSVTVTGDTERWAVERSADGKSLLLKYKPKGTVITLY